MGSADGTVVGPTKIVDHGTDADRYNVVIVGDGFRAADQAAFTAAAASFAAALHAAAPFDRTSVWDRINVHRLDVHSTQSGADNPATCADGSTPASGSATTAATYFDAAFCNNDIRRLLTVDSTLVTTTVNAHVPAWDAIIVVVNHQEYGGSGGSIATYSLAAGADLIGLHEMGHAAFELADEYEYYAGCTSGETDHDTYTDSEPTEPNVTANADAATLKWRHVIPAGQAVAAMRNPDCTACDTRPSTAPAGAIGTFEGARYFHCGAYRPAFDCRMRTIASAFCLVCQEAIVAKVILGSSTPPVSGSTCFVAGAVYGDPDHPDVRALRAWRDRHLEPGARGRTAMRALTAVYDVVGPPAARVVHGRPRLAAGLRRHLFGVLVPLLRPPAPPAPEPVPAPRPVAAPRPLPRPAAPRRSDDCGCGGARGTEDRGGR